MFCAWSMPVFWACIGIAISSSKGVLAEEDSPEAMLRLMASMKLLTSFLVLVSSSYGMLSPCSTSFTRCMARANSGNSNSPALLVSHSVQIFASWVGARPDFIRMALQPFPVMVLDPGWTEALNRVSNLAWSLAVMKDSLMAGILMSLLRPLLAKELTKPVAVGFSGSSGTWYCWA